MWHLESGTEIGGYRIVDVLGSGGMGIVYRAEHPRLPSVVALKLLTPGLAADSTFQERFVLEAKLSSSLNHPNILPVYDAGEADGHLYLAMRLVDGPSLRELLTEAGHLEPARAVALLAQVGSALDAAHARGLVHRDVKPENILVARGGGEFGDHPYLTDFGISKDTGSSGLTKTGQMVGTLNYMAPEQIEGKPVDGRCDEYALGCVLYESLVGSPPFARGSDATVLWAHLNDTPPLVTATRAGAPAALDGVVTRMLAKSPADRYDTCHESFAAARVALAAPAAPPTVPSKERRRPPLAALAALAGVFAAGIGIALILTKPTAATSAESVTTQPGILRVTAGSTPSGHLATGPAFRPVVLRVVATHRTTTASKTPTTTPAQTSTPTTPTSTPTHTTPTYTTPATSSGGGGSSGTATTTVVPPPP